MGDLPGMSDTTDTASDAAPSSEGGAAKKGLSAMLLPELRQLGSSLGIKTAGLRKGDLVAAIKAAQGGGNGGRAATQERSERQERPEKQPDRQPEQQPEQRPEQRADKQQKQDKQ